MLFRALFILIIIANGIARTVCAFVWRRVFANSIDISMAYAKIFVDTCRTLGGAFPKIGQLLSTRADIFPSSALKILEQLQYNVGPVPESFICREIDNWLNLYKGAIGLSSWERKPLASGSIAQVHKGKLTDGREIVLKIKRPGIDDLITKDTALITYLGRLIARLSLFCNIPINQALNEICYAVRSQSNFRLEAEYNRCLAQLFLCSSSIRIPILYESLCTDSILCLEYLSETVRITDESLDNLVAKRALLNGLHALYQMLFLEGVIHCDLHPGNLLVSREGLVMIIDTGFVANMDHEARISFAEFFFSIIIRDGYEAARVLKKVAVQIQKGFSEDGFNSAICALIDRYGGLAAEEFNVVAFVAGLFKIQRDFGVVSSPSFTLPIIALLIYEGIAKQIFPQLDFQQEAFPFVMAALSEQVSATL